MASGPQRKALPVMVVLCWLASMAGAYLLGSRRSSAAHGSFFQSRPAVSGFADGRAPSGTDSNAGPESAGRPPGSSGASITGAQNPGAAKAAAAYHAARLTTLRAQKSSPDQQRALRDFIAKWAESDPAGALAAAGEEPGLKLRSDLRATALTHWAKMDPAKAWAFALENPDGNLPENRLALVLDGIGQSHPQTALKFLQEHAGGLDGSRQSAALSVMEDLYERGNQETVVSWVENLPGGPLRDAALPRLIDRWARYDPEAAQAWMTDHISNPQTLGAARAELADGWARVNPEAALKWVDSLPAGERGSSLYSSIYNRWIDYDRNAAGAALAAQPASVALDKPIERYIDEVMRDNPQDTMPWAESIGDQDRRWRALERVAGEWRKRDPNGLQRYLAGSTLNDSQKRRLLGLPAVLPSTAVPETRAP